MDWVVGANGPADGQSPYDLSFLILFLFWAVTILSRVDFSTLLILFPHPVYSSHLLIIFFSISSLPFSEHRET